MHNFYEICAALNVGRPTQYRRVNFYIIRCPAIRRQQIVAIYLQTYELLRNQPADFRTTWCHRGVIRFRFGCVLTGQV